MPISMKLEKAAAQLEALGNPTRLSIYRILVRAGERACRSGVSRTSSTSPPRRCRITQAADRYGLVTQERQATTLICRANYPGMNALIGYLADECCADGDLPSRIGAERCTAGVIFLAV